MYKRQYVKQYQKIQGHLDALTNQCETLMRAVPENMEEQALSEQITALEQNALLAQNRLQKANTALEHARLALARTEEQLGIFTKQLTEKTILLQQRQTDFHRLMSGSELDEDVYRTLLPKLPEISARRKALEQHKICLLYTSRCV